MEVIGDDVCIYFRCIINCFDYFWFMIYYWGYCVKEVGCKGNVGFKVFMCFVIGCVCVFNGNNNFCFN